MKKLSVSLIMLLLFCLCIPVSTAEYSGTTRGIEEDTSPEEEITPLWCRFNFLFTEEFFYIEQTALLSDIGGADLYKDANNKTLSSDIRLYTGMQLLAYEESFLGYTFKGRYTIVIRGDLTGDGMIHANDARQALRISARLDTENAILLLASDTDGDGYIKAKDARTILRYAAHLF